MQRLEDELSNELKMESGIAFLFLQGRCEYQTGKGTASQLAGSSVRRALLTRDHRGDKLEIRIQFNKFRFHFMRTITLYFFNRARY